MIMPYILTRSINHRHYKDDVITRIKNECQLNNRIQVSSIIVNCWVKVAKACKAIFKSPYIINDSQNDYATLNEILEQMTNILLKVFIIIFLH